MGDLDTDIARKLALAIAKNPTATLHQLASAVGLSKATLYRKANTKKLLIGAVMECALGYLNNIQAKNDLENGKILEVLSSLTVDLVREKEFHSFLVSSAVRSVAEKKHASEADKEWQGFLESMTALFQRGQSEGILRIDVTATWLAYSYGYLVEAALAAELAARLAPAESCAFIEKSFLHGALRGDS